MYGNLESEISTGEVSIVYCYVLQLSIFQVQLEIKRDEQLLCVIPASSGLLYSVEERLRQSDKGE